MGRRGARPGDRDACSRCRSLPLYQLLVGEITQGKLIALEDLSHPLLKQIAEQVARHVAAQPDDGEHGRDRGERDRRERPARARRRLLSTTSASRCSRSTSSRTSSPARPRRTISCRPRSRATRSSRTSPRASSPRARPGCTSAIVDFMHMHHGNGVLEYFWAQVPRAGQPARASPIEDFRYPGRPPQSRETAILAICDAVEAASRTLKKPDAAVDRHRSCSASSTASSTSASSTSAGCRWATCAGSPTRCARRSGTRTTAASSTRGRKAEQSASATPATVSDRPRRGSIRSIARRAPTASRCRASPRATSPRPTRTRRRPRRRPRSSRIRPRWSAARFLSTIRRPPSVAPSRSTRRRRSPRHITAPRLPTVESPRRPDNVPRSTLIGSGPQQRTPAGRPVPEGVPDALLAGPGSAPLRLPPSDSGPRADAVALRRPPTMDPGARAEPVPLGTAEAVPRPLPNTGSGALRSPPRTDPGARADIASRTQTGTGGLRTPPGMDPAAVARTQTGDGGLPRVPMPNAGRADAVQPSRTQTAQRADAVPRAPMPNTGSAGLRVPPGTDPGARAERVDPSRTQPGTRVPPGTDPGRAEALQPSRTQTGSPRADAVPRAPMSNTGSAGLRVPPGTDPGRADAVPRAPMSNPGSGAMRVPPNTERVGVAKPVPPGTEPGVPRGPQFVDPRTQAGGMRPPSVVDPGGPPTTRTSTDKHAAIARTPSGPIPALPRTEPRPTLQGTTAQPPDDAVPPLTLKGNTSSPLRTPAARQSGPIPRDRDERSVVSAMPTIPEEAREPLDPSDSAPIIYDRKPTEPDPPARPTPTPIPRQAVPPAPIDDRSSPWSTSPPPPPVSELDTASTIPPPLRRVRNSPAAARASAVLVDDEPSPASSVRITAERPAADDVTVRRAPALPATPTTLAGHAAGPNMGGSPFDEDNDEPIPPPVRRRATTASVIRREDMYPKAPMTLPDAPWAAGLAARIDAAIDDDFGGETPVIAPTREELQALLGSPEPTRQVRSKRSKRCGMPRRTRRRSPTSCVRASRSPTRSTPTISSRRSSSHRPRAAHRTSSRSRRRRSRSETRARRRVGRVSPPAAAPPRDPSRPCATRSARPRQPRRRAGTTSRAPTTSTPSPPRTIRRAIDFARHKFGETLATWGEFAEAIAQLEKAVAARPGDAAAWHDLGILREHDGNVDGAIAALEKRATSPRTTTARAGRSRSLLLEARLPRSRRRRVPRDAQARSARPPARPGSSGRSTSSPSRRDRKQVSMSYSKP